MTTNSRRESMNSTKSVDNELDQYDLLGAGDSRPSAALPETDLSATTQAFNTRIQRKKREQEKVLSEAEKLAKQRHLFMIHALMNIRKSLRDVTRIDLGDRFHFALQADDWHGWPRLTVKLVDTLLPAADYPFLRVTAHDRQSKGTIELEYDPSQPAEGISLVSESELKRMPNLLKKCVRAFLDLTGDIVLEAERRTEEVVAEGALKNPHMEDIEDPDAGSVPELSGDLFQEELGENNFLETLPSIEQVESLPSSGSASAAKKK